MAAPGVKRLFNRAGAHVHCSHVPPQAKRINWLRVGSDAFFKVCVCLPGLEDMLNIKIQGCDDFCETLVLVKETVAMRR